MVCQNRAPGGALPRPDLIIVARGGGSIEDLQAFNTESVARAIASSALPICSAVGHETDFTIADFVADCRAPTPSAAAELVSLNREDQLLALNAFSARLVQHMNARLRASAKQLQWLSRGLKRPDRRLQEQAQRLDGLESRLLRAWEAQRRARGSRVALLERRLQGRSPAQRLARLSDQLGAAQRRAVRAMASVVAQKRTTLSLLGRSLNTVSPLNTLARGYSLNFDEAGRLLKSVDAARVGSRLTTRLADGLIVSEILTIEKQEEGASSD